MGGGLAGSAMDPRVNAAAGGVQGLGSSPQKQMQQTLLRPQSFGLHNLIT